MTEGQAAVGAADLVAAPPKKPTNTGRLILTSLLSGIAVGLFFGEYCAPLKVVGDAFVQLLQMTVLPYIVLSLIVNIGRLSLQEAHALGRRAGVVLLALWGLGIVVVVLLPFSFPTWQTGSFFSTSFIEPAREIDLIGLYIPSNPFHSMANNVVPATVLFSIFLGVALIGVPDRQDFLRQMETLVEGLTRVSGLIFKLAPVGIFAIAAGAAGTMTMDEMGRLQGYLLSYTAAVALLTFWLIPGLVAAVTPFRYRDVMLASRASLVTAFATGKLFIVLPILIEDAKALFERRVENLDPDAVKDTEALVPLAYPFPHLGKLTILIFLPFAAWFFGRPLGLESYPSLIGAGVVSLFGSPMVAVPFLLELFELPADMFQLFVVAGVYCGQIGDALGAMHLLAFTLLVGCASAGMIEIRWHRVFGYLVVSILLVGLTVAGSRAFLSQTIQGAPRSEDVLRNMKLLEPPVPTVLAKAGESNPVPLVAGQSALDRIEQRGVLRIGFDVNGFPFSYIDDAGRPVGFDVDMARRLATDLDVTLEFVPIQNGEVALGLAADQFDLAVGGLPGTVERSVGARFLPSHLDGTLALLVRDHRVREFASAAAIRENAPLRIGTDEKTRLVIDLERQLVGSKFVQIESELAFLNGEYPEVDALIAGAERAFAMTLLYPDFQVVNPFGRRQGIPMVYMIRPGEEDLHRRLSAWIEIVKLDGTIDRFFEYWVLGKDAVPHRPRWSVIRDVLGWVD